MKRLIIVALLAALVLATGAFAMKGSAEVVKVAPVKAAVEGIPGQRVAFEIKVNIDKKWHLYAHGDSNFIGVDLVPDEGFILKDFQAVYPKGHEKEFFGDKVFMIEGQNTIQVSAQVPGSVAIGDHELKFSLTAQACDDKTCLAPASIPVSVKLTVK